MRILTKAHNSLLWALLLLLTTILLLWPVRYSYKYEAVQSLSVLDSPFIFGAVFIVWMTILLQISRRGSFLFNVLLICMFSLVFNAFWLINSPYIAGASFDPSGIAYSNYIVEHGTITFGDPAWGYFEFPTTPLLGASVSQATGLSVFDSSKIILIIACLLVPVSAYLLYSKSLGNSKSSLLAVIIGLLGSVHFIFFAFFRPGTIGFVLFAVLLAFIGTRKGRFGRTPAETVIFTVLFLALVMTHFMTSVAFFLILVGIYIYSRLTSAASNPLSASIMVLAAGLCLAWWFYESLYTTEFVLQRFDEFLAEPTGVSMDLALQKGEALIGVEVPIWARLVRTFWLLLLYLVPSLIALVIYTNFMIRRKRGMTPRIEEGALLGLVVLLVIMTVSDQGANRAISQFLLFGALIMPPVFIRFLYGTQDVTSSPNRTWQRVGSVLVILTLVLLSFPTFLAHHPSANTQIRYDTEHSAFAFLRSHSEELSEIALFADIDTGYMHSYYLPDTEFYPIPYPPDYVADDEEFLMRFPRFLQDFNDLNKRSFFMYSPRMLHRPNIYLGIPEDHPIWAESAQAFHCHNIIYDNGFVWSATNDIN